MGKQQYQNNQSNKGHKTLRDKLRKKRQQLKNHKKQKNEKHKQYDAEENKKKFFEQTNAKKKKRQDGIKEKKLNKYIQKFVDIYEDDVEDFYDLFQTLDQGGSVDISNVADPKMQKCLKKMFKYLPLKKKKMEYMKKQGAETKLRVLMVELVTKSIENYMENGTDNQQKQSEKQSSADENIEGEQNKKQKKKHKNKQKQEFNECIDREQEKVVKAELEHKTLREYERLKLYNQRFVEKEPEKQVMMGPSITAEQRQFLAKMVQQQAKNEGNQEGNDKNEGQQQNNEFQRIFSMASSSKKSQAKSGQPRANIDDIPSQLLAEGSARIGQKQEIDPDQIEEYNKLYRPRKLIEEHQEMRKIGKFAQTEPDGKKKRVPFDRERDIVNGRSRQFMNNGVFFDFKDRMTKPKGTNNFL